MRIVIGRGYWAMMLLAMSLASGAAAAPASAAGGVSAIGAPRVEIRPGPDILYAPPANSPLLGNRGIWHAPAILVSGASAYRGGEFLYQDYLYDDQGARNAQSYPAEAKYAGDAADFLEIRVKPLADATAVRITYNTMLDPGAVATTLAFGDSPAAYPMPHGANTKSPGRIFVTVHGTTGDIVDAATGKELSETPRVSTDLTSHQVDVQIPYSAFDPRGDTVRVAAATGLWDGSTGSYIARSAGTSAFYNVAFRYDETGKGNSDNAQSTALGNGDISPFYARVDFAKLTAGVDDEMADAPGGVPRVGYMQRIYVSHFQDRQGQAPPNTTCLEPCNEVPEDAGQLQPYSVYIPTTAPPPGGYGMVLYLHALGANYRPSYVGGPGDTDPFGEPMNAIVIFPNARGTGMWYWGEAAADVFEAASDVMRRYPVNTTRIAMTGISMGGYGTYRLSSLWPDLFTGIAPIVGCTSAETSWDGPPVAPTSGEAAFVGNTAASWRNVPIFSQNGAVDNTCSANAQDQLLKTVDGYGYRYIWREYPGEHALGYLEPVTLDPNARMEFLRGLQTNPDPAHITYVLNLLASQTRYGLNADHAYWIGGLRLRDGSGAAPMGTIDVSSHGFGVGDPPPQITEPIAGPGYAGAEKQWGAPARTPIEDRLDITTSNIAAVTIDVRRARVSCNVKLNVTSDGPLAVTLAGCPPASTTATEAARQTRPPRTGRGG